MAPLLTPSMTALAVLRILKEFNTQAAGQFRSGWAWLVKKIRWQIGYYHYIQC